MVDVLDFYIAIGANMLRIAYAESDWSIKTRKTASYMMIITCSFPIVPVTLIFIGSVYYFKHNPLLTIELFLMALALLSLSIYIMVAAFSFLHQAKNVDESISEFKNKTIFGNEKFPKLYRIYLEDISGNGYFTFHFEKAFWRIPISVSIPINIVNGFLISIKRKNSPPLKDEDKLLVSINEELINRYKDSEEFRFLNKLYGQQQRIFIEGIMSTEYASKKILIPDNLIR